MKTNQWVDESGGGDVLRGLVAGLTGGIVGSAAMELFQKAWSAVSGETGGDQEPGKHHGQRGGERQQPQADSEEPATVKMAEAVSTRIFHHELTEKEKKVAGPAVHYTYGALVGGLYGAVSEVAPMVTIGGGSGYATAVFVLGDEVAVPALRLSKPPTEHPPSVHAYALLSHLVYGMALEATRRAVRRMI